MHRISRIAFYVGMAGVAVLALFAFLVLASYIDWLALTLALPLALGVGAVRGPWGRRREAVAIRRHGGTLPEMDGMGSLPPDLLKKVLEGVSQPAGGIASWVSGELRKLSHGVMSIVAPKKAYVGREDMVVVEIGKGEEGRVLSAIGADRQLAVEAIKVGALMRVELGGRAFAIENPPHLDKIVGDEHPARWEFRIVPRERGEHALTVRTIVRLKLPGGGEEYYELPPVEKRIVVSVTAGYVVKKIFAIPFVRFAAWVWGAIVAIGGFVVALDPVKAWAGERLKPVLEWITRQL